METNSPRVLVGPGRYYQTPPTMLTAGQTRRANVCEALGLQHDVPDADFKYPLPPSEPDPNDRLAAADLEAIRDL